MAVEVGGRCCHTHEASADVLLPLGGFFQMPHVGSVTWVLPLHPAPSPTVPEALGLESVFSSTLHSEWLGHCALCSVCGGEEVSLRFGTTVDKGKEVWRELWTENGAHVFQTIPRGSVLLHSFLL